MRSGYNIAGYVYVAVPEHPHKNKGNKVAYHRIVMEKHLGRYLLPHENVHHKNAIRDDNRLDNLELWSSSQPAGGRVEDIVAFAVEQLQLYAPELLK